MARNESNRFRDQSADRAHLRAGAESWRALANLTVASTLVVAVVVSALTLLEAVFSDPAQRLAQRASRPSELQAWHVRTPVHEPFLPTPTQLQPALLVAD